MTGWVVTRFPQPQRKSVTVVDVFCRHHAPSERVTVEWLSIVCQLKSAIEMLCLRMMPSLNRCTRLQSGFQIMQYSFTSISVPVSQRPPLKLVHSLNSRVLACELATVSDVGQGEGHDQTIPHVPVLLSEVLAAFSAVNLKVHTPAGCLLATHAPEQNPKNVQTYVDGTLGAAGHAQALIQQHPVRLLKFGCCCAVV